MTDDEIAFEKFAAGELPPQIRAIVPDVLLPVEKPYSYRAEPEDDDERPF